MKTLKFSVILALLGTLTLGMADDATIDEQISAIKDAPAQERVRLMNQFKKRVSTLSEQDREAAITQLRAKTEQATQTQTRTRERSRINQKEQTENMQRNEYMHQHQTASRFKQQDKIGGNQGTMGRK